MVRKAFTNVGKCPSTYKCRNKRTRPQPVRIIMTRSQMKTSSGRFFQKLPSEVRHMILDNLSILEVSVFSMVSKEFNSYVLIYVNTLAWKNKMIVQPFHHLTCHEHVSNIEHYRDLGLLFKRCTMLLSTKVRLKYIFSKFSQVPCFLLEQCSVPDCLGFSSYGVFLQTLIAGWDELECQRVFIFLCDLTNLLQKMESVLTGNPGVKWYQELQLRLFCRHVFLDPWPNQPDCQFWLIELLKPWPMVSQARLLLILYGPLLPEATIDWQNVVERGQPHSALWHLARAILLLFSRVEVKRWTTDSLLAILEELFVIPQPWHVENVARFLVLCGNDLCYNVLASKALNGRAREISKLIVHIVLVCEKDCYQMSWPVKLVERICKVFSTAPEKLCFIQHLENTFSEVTKEFFEFSVEGNHLENGETFHALCTLLEASASFHTKLLSTFLKWE